MERDYDYMTFKISQSVLIQIFGDKFYLPSGKTPKAYSSSGYILMKVKPDESMS